MASTYLAPETPEAHAEVDFMTMFTTQNDDRTTHEQHVKTPSTQQLSHVVPVASVPAQDPLHVFDSAMYSGPVTTDAWAAPQQQQHVGSFGALPAGTDISSSMVMGGMAPVAYAPQVTYHQAYQPQYHQQHQQYQGSLGNPFTHSPAQYVEPSVALRPSNSRPATATSQFSVSSASAPNTPVAPAAAQGAEDMSAKAQQSPATSISSSTTPPPASQAAANDNTARIVRRKRKLTPEDKRRICEIYRNSQGKIRQEDIAKEYSVDRSTISKILNQEDRWLDPDAPGSNSLLSRRPGGRYPAIEEEMHRWLDEAVMQGREVRDSEAREEALKIGHRLGHPHFQASSKWWDGVKRRRVEEGRALPSSRRMASSVMTTPPMSIPGLTRTYTAMSLDSPHQAYPGMPGPSAAYTMISPHTAAAYAGMVPVTPALRARSQSAPQQFGVMQQQQQQQQPSSFGPVPRQRMSPSRHSPVTPLTRNRSYHGSSGSPARPALLNRANSANGRPSAHQRLGASAFGLTPVNAELQQQQQQQPSPSQQDMSSEGASATSMPSLSPLSGAPSEASDTMNASALSPSTPCTPAQTNFQVPTVPQPQFVDMTCQQPVMYQQPMAVYPGYQAGVATQYTYPAYEYQAQW